jgi:site-specific recombinase XerD
MRTNDNKNQKILKYKNWLKENNKTAKTIKGYSEDLIFFYSWLNEIYEDKVDIKRINETDLEAYQHMLVKERNLKATSINKKTAVIKHFFGWLYMHNMIEKDPSVSLSYKRIQKPETPASLTGKEIHSLLIQAGKSYHGMNKRNYIIIKLILETGLSTGELTNLKIKDFSLYERSGFLLKKNGMSLALSNNLRNALTDYLSGRKINTPEEFLFFSKRGTPMSERSIHDTIRKVADKVKISVMKVSGKTLRETFVINYLQENPGHEKDVIKILGLSSSSSFMSKYRSYIK